jgi:hypothetical protein
MPSTIYAGTNGSGVFKSVDGGGTWASFNNGLTANRILSLAIDRTRKTLHAGSSGNSVFDYYFVPATSFYTLTPCRVADTRNSPGPLGGPSLAANSDRTFVIAGQCGIPSTAQEVAFNFTVTQPTGPGDLRVAPGGLGLPLVSTLNWRPGQTRAGNAIVTLGPSGEIVVHLDQASGTVDFIADVSGYFQ